MEKKEYLEESPKGPSRKIVQLQSYIAALLMLVPSMNIQSKTQEITNNNVPVYYSKEKRTFAMEALVLDNEALFISAIAQTLKSVNKLTDIPEGGLVLKYTQTPVGDYPKTINFFPKEMKADRLPYSVVQVGEKMFIVKPEMGFEVDDMYIDAEAFYVEVTMETIFGDVTKTTTKDKDDELGEYLRKLYSQGENGRYLGSSVTEVPKNLQETFLKEFNKLNV